MAFVRLPIYEMPTEHLFPRSVVSESGAVELLPWLRLMAHLLVGPDPTDYRPDQRSTFDPRIDRRPDPFAYIDTGATMSVFPKAVWRPFEGAITRLELNPEEVEARPPEQRSPTIIQGGGSYPYFLGRIDVGIRDFWDHRLPSISITARFRTDDIPADQSRPPPLVGLWGGILTGRRFGMDPTADGQEPDPPPAMPRRFRRTFGMRWWLSDP